MATTMQIGDPAFYQGKKGKVVALPKIIGEEGRVQGVTVEYTLPKAEANSRWDEDLKRWIGRPKVTLEIGENGKPTGNKIEAPWDVAVDGPRNAQTTGFAADLRWDTGREAWIFNGHALKTVSGKIYPDQTGEDSLLDEKPGKEG